VRLAALLDLSNLEKEFNRRIPSGAREGAMTDNRKNTDLVMVVASDISGQLRGKAMPLRAKVLRTQTGVGWTGTCVQITSFGPIADSPWGPRGDLLIRPDYSTMVDLSMPEYNVNECFVIGDIFTLEDDA